MASHCSWSGGETKGERSGPHDHRTIDGLTYSGTDDQWKPLHPLREGKTAPEAVPLKLALDPIPRAVRAPRVEAKAADPVEDELCKQLARLELLGDSSSYLQSVELVGLEEQLRETSKMRKKAEEELKEAKLSEPELKDKKKKEEEEAKKKGKPKPTGLAGERVPPRSKPEERLEYFKALPDRKWVGDGHTESTAIIIDQQLAIEYWSVKTNTVVDHVKRYIGANGRDVYFSGGVPIGKAGEDGTRPYRPIYFKLSEETKKLSAETEAEAKKSMARYDKLPTVKFPVPRHCFACMKPVSSKAGARCPCKMAAWCNAQCLLHNVEYHRSHCDAYASGATNFHRFVRGVINAHPDEFKLVPKHKECQLLSNVCISMCIDARSDATALYDCLTSQQRTEVRGALTDRCLEGKLAPDINRHVFRAKTEPVSEFALHPNSPKEGLSYFTK